MRLLTEQLIRDYEDKLMDHIGLSIDEIYDNQIFDFFWGLNIIQQQTIKDVSD